MKHTTTNEKGKKNQLVQQIKKKLPFNHILFELYPKNCTGNRMALCPWHDDASPSLSIYDDHGYCRAESKRYDVFNLWQLKHNCDFKTALRELAERAGVELPSGKGGRQLNGEPTSTYNYVNESGTLLCQHCRWETTGADGKPDKTFSWRQPDGNGGWINNLKAVSRRVLYKLPEVLAAETVWIVEGEKDALSLVPLGLCATTPPDGADQRGSKWLGLVKKYKIHEPLKGKNIYILPDNDEPGRQHANAVARSLHGFATSVKILDLATIWPEIPLKGDVSDFISHHGPEEAKRLLLELAETTSEYVDLTPPEEATEESKKSKGYRFMPLALVNRIRSDTPVISFNGTFYRYESGVYRLWAPENVDQTTIGLIPEDALRGYHLKEVRTVLQSVSYVQRETVNQHGILNLRNGLLDLENGKIKPHTSDFLSTVQLPISFNPDAQCPQFLTFLNTKLPDTSLRAIVQEIAGYLLTASSRLQRAFLIIGKRRTGKSTLIKVLTALLGKENVSNVSLDRLGDRFQTAAIDGKLANFSTELNVKTFVQDGILKAIITGDDVMGEEKHKTPYSFRPFCRIMAAMNDLPLSHDVNPAFFRRWIPIPMNEVHEEHEDISALDEKIISTELDGVLLWALAGLHRLRERRRFTESQASREIMESWERLLDPVREFAHRFLVIEPGSKVLLQSVYKAFNEWCKATNRKSQFNDSNLRKRLESVDYTFKKTNIGWTLFDCCLASGTDGLESDAK